MHRSRLIRVAGLLAVGACTGVLVASASGSHEATISPSPAWTDAQLSAPSAANWLEYYGDLSGSRYSSLNQITTSNVGTLKEVWHMSLGTCTASILTGDPGGSGRSARGSEQPDELRLDGVEPRRGRRHPLHDERAARPDLRDRRRDRQHHLDVHAFVCGRDPPQRHGFTPGNGGRRPGVAVGEGKVYTGLPDGRLVALDQTTGKVVWETRSGSYKVNAKISSAPIYVHGMVIVGDGSGDGGGASPSLQAFRAANGAPIWSWSPIPPRAEGLQDVDSERQERQRQHELRRRLVLGGAGRRHEEQGADRRHRKPGAVEHALPGSDLYTDSIVALDLYTAR